MVTVAPKARLPLLALGGAGLIWGMWLGLSRLGAAPVLSPRALSDHGPLMVSGFLGTVIALERAVAAGTLWSYLGPVFCAIGVALHLVGQPAVGALAMTAGSAVVVAILLQVFAGDRALHHAVLVVAALGWFTGNVLYALGRPVFDVVPFWIVYLVGTIAAERLELSRMMRRTLVTLALFVIAAGLVVAGAAVTLGDRELGMRLLGGGEVLLCAWMFRFDIARRTVRQHLATRYIAVALLLGYLWLGIGGVLALVFGHPIAGPRYDALLHSVFVGFVFSMIFGHALVILPSVAGARVDFKFRFYAHLGLLHLSVAARVLGDLLSLPTLRIAGAWANAIAVLLFLGSTLLAVRGKVAPGQAVPHG